MNVIDRWIIGGLIFAVSVILWMILMDVKQDIRNLHINEAINSTRLATVEERVRGIDRDLLDVKGELGKHRQATEIH